MNELKLSAALEDCLRRCLASDRPYYELSQALGGYKADRDWTPAEVVELQTRVIRALMGHWRGSDKN
ncbi:MAG: hypothetical protein IAF94_14595 [Pirellulaceae bacterium]|nr:hypothetical protein [Pirellulaceae bacterium]